MTGRNAWSSAVFGSCPAPSSLRQRSLRAYNVPRRARRREQQVSRARQFGTIRRLPSGRYQARYWHLGQQVSAGTTFATKTEARAWLASVETDQRRGDFVDPRSGAERFGTYAQRWLDERDLRPRTRETYESQLVWILDTFGTTR